MSALRTSTTIDEKGWRDMSDLYRSISACPVTQQPDEPRRFVVSPALTTIGADELERFTDAFVRTLKENEAAQGDLSHCECRQPTAAHYPTSGVNRAQDLGYACPQ